MIFNSIEYAVFLGIIALVYWRLPRSFRPALLLGASYFFYGWWDVRFLALIIVSTVVDYLVALGISQHRETHGRRLIMVSLLVNLGMLATFKYFDFFASSLNSMLAELGLSVSAPLLRVALPIGISFYTFQTLAYTIDVYRGHVQAERNPIVFAAFVSFFPQLVAGPIERASRLLPQIRDPHPLTFLRFENAGRLLIRGLVRKVVIADTMAPIVNGAFGSADETTLLSVVVATTAFALQIYGDFLGYTDIARGSAALFGIDLVPNFRQPYLSQSVTDFWRRWHISLSDWLRDYLYIPLGGNRKGPRRTLLNLFLVMALGGLWHGAAWNFVAWGVWQGSGLIAERVGGLKIFDDDRGLHTKVIRLGYTLAFTAFGWVLFRVDRLSDVLDMAAGLGRPGLGSLTPNDFFLVLVAGTLTLAFDLKGRAASTDRLDRQTQPVVAGLLTGAAIIALLIAARPVTEPFIYFQF